VKADTTVAKKYLLEGEIRTLDRLTTQFLDFAEGQAERRLVTTMEQWVTATDRLIAVNGYPVLGTRGSVSHQAVEAIVDGLWPEFDRARKQREYEESWRVEASDITELLALEKGKN